MEKLFWIILIIILMAIGIILFFIELETEEIEYFGPISIILLISGTIIWFIVNSSTTIGSPEVFLFISIIMVSVPIIIIFITIYLIRKIKKLADKPPEISANLIGKDGICAEEITAESHGYVRYKSELWKATSSSYIKKGQKVKITNQDQLLVIVEPTGPMGSLYCPNCGKKINLESRFCSDCGIKI